MEEPSDAELVARAQAGDKDAFGHLITRYAPLARRLARGLVADADLAGDLAQEAMLQAYLSLARLRDGTRFRSWFYGIVLNVYRSYIRDRGTAAGSLDTLDGGRRFEGAAGPAQAPDPHAVLEARELHRQIQAAVAFLSPRVRAATLLFYYQELSLQEIAAILGVSVVAVKSRLHKARKELRDRLAPVYAEHAAGAPAIRRTSLMIPVTIADVALRGTPPEQQYVVLLWDAAGRRVLPIWVGPPEGQAIALGLRNLPTERPVTYPFIANLLGALDAQLEEVRIETLKNDTFYAVVKLRSGATVREVDARPSDALALAVRTGSPIRVAPAVLDQSGIPVPAAQGEPRGTGATAIVESFKAQLAQIPIRLRSPADKEQEAQEFLAFAFAGPADAEA